MNRKTAAIIIGLIFVAVGCLGFIPNPIVGEAEGTIFYTDQVHNIVHIVSGVLFLLIAMAMATYVGGFLKLFGLVYLLLGVLGMINIGSEGMTKLLGFLHVNGADNFLHIGLGVVIFLAGTLRPASAT